MTKRILSITFVFVANLVLLAHFVIPHHHHQNQVCFVDTHCEAHHDAEPETDHQHHSSNDSSNDSENCILKQVVVLPANQIKTESVPVIYFDSYSDFTLIQAVLALAGFERDISPDEKLATPVSSIHLYSCIVGRNIGLRAPPTV